MISAAVLKREFRPLGFSGGVELAPLRSLETPCTETVQERSMRRRSGVYYRSAGKSIMEIPANMSRAAFHHSPGDSSLCSMCGRRRFKTASLHTKERA